jgi:predicted  nucleic acid-binding Zn-ribbon protein
MNVQLKEITLNNFMGAQNQTINFGAITDISGKNASGKTRIFNAWNWLMFGKDIEDRKDYQIKTLDENNEPLHRVDTSVKGLLVIDGMEKTFRRTYREKWQKKRGEEETEFTGHETVFEVDGVPMLQNEYKKAVDAVLTEETFKMLTNPFYFASLRWDQRREILFKIVRPVSDTTIGEMMPEFSALLKTMAGKPIDLYRREVAGKKKAIKDELIQVPPRIDELMRAIPVGVDYAAIAKQIDTLEAEATDIDKKIKSKTARYEAKNKENIAIQHEIQTLKLKLQGLENQDALARDRRSNELATEIHGTKMRIARHEDTINSYAEHIKARQRTIDDMTADIDRKREEWNRVNAEQPDTGKIALVCFACGQSLPKDDIEARTAKMTAEFNADKVTRLDRITQAGEHLKKNIEHEQEEIRKSETLIKMELEVLNEENIKLKVLQETPANVPDLRSLDDPGEIIKKEIAALTAKIEDIAPVDTRDLVAQLTDVNDRSDKLKAQFVLKEVEMKNRSRIEDLKLQERNLSQQLADLEKSEFLIDKFERVRVTMIEDEINRKFATVRFKMFTHLINGGTEPCCEILIDGVPFGAANNAARINAGIDIINTLSEFYDCTAPIFVDNSEAVNQIIPTRSQLIRLIVTTEPELQTKIIEL